MIKKTTSGLFLVIFVASLLFAKVPYVNAQATDLSLKLTVTSPSVGETIHLGDKVKVSWNTSNVPQDEILVIDFNIKDASFAQVYTKNTGATVISLPYKLPNNYLNKQASISVYAMNGSEARGSSGLLNVSPCSGSCSTPSIKVLSPGVGDQFNPGDEVTIKWSSSNIPANADVFMSMSPYPGLGNVNTTTSPVISYVLKTKNTGQAKLLLPEAGAFGVLLDPASVSFSTKYKIYIAYYYFQGTNIPMSNAYPEPANSGIYTNKLMTDSPFSESVSGESDLFVIDSAKKDLNIMPIIAPSPQIDTNLITSDEKKSNNTVAIKSDLDTSSGVGLSPVSSSQPVKATFWNRAGSFFSKFFGIFKFW